MKRRNGDDKEAEGDRKRMRKRGEKRKEGKQKGELRSIVAKT